MRAQGVNGNATEHHGRSSSPGGAEPLELALLEGQCAALSLTLENVGKLEIDHVTVDVASSGNVLAKYARDRHPLVHFTGAPPPLHLLRCGRRSRCSQ